MRNIRGGGRWQFESPASRNVAQLTRDAIDLWGECRTVTARTARGELAVPESDALIAVQGT